MPLTTPERSPTTKGRVSKVCAKNCIEDINLTRKLKGEVERS
jgi:hypothetical protein